MKCPTCKCTKLVKSGKLWGKNHKKIQRYQCTACGRTTLYPKA